MVRAQTTREQAEIAKQTGCGLFAYAVKSGGTVSADGPIPHDVAEQLTRLVMLVLLDRVPADKLAAFVDALYEDE